MCFPKPSTFFANQLVRVDRIKVSGMLVDSVGLPGAPGSPGLSPVCSAVLWVPIAALGGHIPAGCQLSPRTFT